MAVTSSPKAKTMSPGRPQVSSPMIGSPTETKKERKRKVDASANKVKEMKSGNVGSTSQGGIRIVGCRIYDPLNGKTCHQCRQKTIDFAASCKNLKGDKQCTVKLCHKCLLNRYGERAEEVALLDDWKCPKCRGICNCSFCMKKKGQRPTGQLYHKAKENGFSSVSELLETRAPEILDDLQAMKVVSDQSPTFTAKLEKLDKMKREGLKEISNGIDASENVGESGYKKARVASNTSPSGCEAEEIKPDINDECLTKKKKKSLVSDNGFAVTCAKLDTAKHPGSEAEEIKSGIVDVGLAKKKKKQMVSNNGFTVTCGNGKLNTASHSGAEVEEIKPATSEVGLAKKKKKIFVSDNTCGNGKLDTASRSGAEGSNSLDVFEAAMELRKMSDSGRASNGLKDSGQPLMKSLQDDLLLVEPQIPLLFKTCISAVAGIDFSPEDVGNALQFLEFCAAFGKALCLKKGQPEAAMREMVIGQRERRSQYRSQQSLLTQIHVRLLHMIQEDVLEESEILSMKNLKNTWFQALGKFISECEFLSKEFPSESFERGVEGYEELKVSDKLKLLIFLCDEALNTNALRNWIDDENSKFQERLKKAKEKVSAAKEKERQLRQKAQDEIAKALIERNGAPFTISEHDALILDVKSKAAEAHVEMLRALGMVHRKKTISDAIRTEPVLSDIDGRVFWRLNCSHGLSDVLQQDLSNWSCASPDEKWFCYAPEQKEEVENYISGMKRRKGRHVPTNHSLGEINAA